MFALVVSYGSVTESVLVAEDESTLLGRVDSWEPGAGPWQDFGYKKSLLIREGVRGYEIFECGTLTNISE